MQVVLEVRDVVKAYGGLRPFRMRNLHVAKGEQVAIGGPDGAQASVLVDLLTGTTLPDAGEVRVNGVRTGAIESQEAWLSFLEAFGLVSERVVLLSELTVVQNLAVPLTLSVDPIPSAIRPRVEELAAEVGLPRAALDASVAGVGAAERARIRLGRAVAHDPSILLLEHPTWGLDREDSGTYAADLRTLAERRQITVLAVTADLALRRLATRVLEWKAASGDLAQPGLSLRRLMRG